MLKTPLLTLTRSLLAKHLFIMPYPDVLHVSCAVAPTATCTRAATPLANLAGLYLQVWLESHSKCRRPLQGLSI